MQLIVAFAVCNEITSASSACERELAPLMSSFQYSSSRHSSSARDCSWGLFGNKDYEREYVNIFQ